MRHSVSASAYQAWARTSKLSVVSAVAAALRARCGDALEILEESGEGASLMEAWEGAESVIVVDAARAGMTPGTVFRFNAAKERIPSSFLHYSTHAFGVAEAIEMARALGALPPRIVLYRRTIELRSELGEDRAELVHDALVEQVADLLGLDEDDVDPGFD